MAKYALIGALSGACGSIMTSLYLKHISEDEATFKHPKFPTYTNYVHNTSAYTLEMSTGTALRIDNVSINGEDAFEKNGYRKISDRLTYAKTITKDDPLEIDFRRMKEVAPTKTLEEICNDVSMEVVYSDFLGHQYKDSIKWGSPLNGKLIPVRTQLM